MSLTKKLVLWFLCIALGVGVVNAVWIARVRTMRAQFSRFANVSMPRESWHGYRLSSYI